MIIVRYKFFDISYDRMHYDANPIFFNETFRNVVLYLLI